MMGRRCSRSGCSGIAVATLTFDYASSTAVLGRLSPATEPGSYDLCLAHAQSTTAPRGWELLTIAEIDPCPPAFEDSDLLALANAIREIGFSADENPPEPDLGNSVVELGRKRHLRVIADSGR